jgi:predicted Zn-dependent protease
MQKKALMALAVSLVALVGASDGIAQQRTRSISQNSLAQAAQNHPQVVAEFGGEAAAAPSAYVRSVGARVANQTNIAGGGNAFHITTLNSPVMNAFAVPGGYLYITRQLVALSNDEAELAFVLGHEAGHVAARHNAARQRTSILTQIASVLAGVVTGSGQLAQIVGQVGQGVVLSYSRSQEFEADDLGVRYMTAAGYDPSAGSTMLASLGNWTSLESRLQGRGDAERAVPSWARTHPLSADRVSRSSQKAQATGRAGQGVRNPAPLLAAINGMYFDDDPAQGIVEGREFRHPDLRLAFTAPQGFGMQNSTRSVSVVGQSGQAQFGTIAYSGDLDRYIGQVFQSIGGNQAQVQYTRPQHTTINGLPAAVSSARAQTQSGVVDVTVVAYEFANNRAYHFITVTPGGSGIGAFGPMIESVRRLSAQEVASIRPRVLQIVTVGPRDTVQSLSNRMAYDSYREERFRSLNGLTSNGVLQPGRQVKLVVYGQRRA